MSICLHDLENLIEGTAMTSVAHQRRRPVLTLLSGSTKLARKLSGIADIADELVASFP
jgi:hypothetical protein